MTSRNTTLKDRLHTIVNDPDTPGGRIFAGIIQLLIFISLVSITLDTFRDLRPALRQTLNVLDYAILLIFTLEYLLRLWVAPSRPAYAFSIWGIIDFLAIAPFWLLGGDTRILRSLRLLRLVKVMRFSRYARALHLLAQAFNMVRDEIIAFLGIVILLLYMTAYAIWQFESAAQPDRIANMFDAFWWAVITLTTIGYGDVYPITVGGRIFTMVIVLLGLGMVAVPSGLLASAFQEIRRRERECPANREDTSGKTPEN